MTAMAERMASLAGAGLASREGIVEIVTSPLQKPVSMVVQHIPHPYM